MPGILKREIPFDEKLSKQIIGERIAHKRKQRGLTQVELAEMLGIERVLVSDYERGKIRIYGDMIARIAIALKTTTDELLGIKDEIAEQTPSLALMKRMLKIEQLNSSEKKSLVKTIDMVLGSLENK